MIISHLHKFIFIKSRKTAGTTFEIILSDICGDEDIITKLGPDEELRSKLSRRSCQNYTRTLDGVEEIIIGHSSASVAKELVSELQWSSYYKFCFERNPYERWISMYYWATRNQSKPPEINRWIKKRISKDYSRDQKLYNIKGESALDCIYRFEDLGNAYLDIQNKLGVKFRLGLEDVSAKSQFRKTSKPYSKILSDETITLYLNWSMMYLQILIIRFEINLTKNV